MDTTELDSLVKRLKGDKDEDTLQKIQDWAVAELNRIARQVMNNANYSVSLQNQAMSLIAKHRDRKSLTSEDTVADFLKLEILKPLLSEEAKVTTEQKVLAYALERILVVAVEGKIDELEKLLELLHNPKADKDIMGKIAEHNRKIQAAIDMQAKVKLCEEAYMLVCILLGYWILKNY